MLNAANLTPGQSHVRCSSNISISMDLLDIAGREDQRRRRRPKITATREKSLEVEGKDFEDLEGEDRGIQM